MSKIHIGKKIREVLDKSHLTIVDFAKSINLTRDGAYKIFDKETIATDQLQKISAVLNHDFFSYYQKNLNVLNDKESPYGYAAKEDVMVLAKLVQSLSKDIEKLRQEIGQIPGSKVKRKKSK
jgi:hypothetical protein